LIGTVNIYTLDFTSDVLTLGCCMHTVSGCLQVISQMLLSASPVLLC